MQYLNYLYFKQLEGRGKFVPFNDLYVSAIVFSKRPKLLMAWNSTLDIGNELKIPVVGYIKVDFNYFILYL